MAFSFESLVGGRYEIGERLGVGGMSEVYAATDQRLGRQVAVKFLRSEIDDPSARARIESEARAAAALSHPNIVNVYDAGDHDGRPYVVMELADSRSLADVIREEGPLPAARVRTIGTQVLAALDAAHSQGFVHRDVKPANILVRDDSSVKLADFGIAKSFSDAAAGLTGVGLVMGTPTYLSPEQAAGEPATPRSDLYAMGVVLFEALTGSPPFTGDTPMAVVTAHSHAPVPDIRAAAPGVPASLAAVVERALAKDPAGRHADANEMARALEVVPPAEPTSAVAVTETAPLAVRSAPTGALPARARRSRAPAVMGSGAALLLLLLLFLALQGGGKNELTPVGATSTTDPARTTTSAEEATPATTRQPLLSIGDLLGALEDNPESFGESGPELLDKLRDVMGADGDKQAEMASNLQDEIRKWAENGELDAAVSARAIEFLEPLAVGGRGNPGGGKGKDKDDD